MKIIGQEKLVNKLNSYTVKTLPNTIMFIGEPGCGKHTFTRYLANKLNLELVTIEATDAILGENADLSAKLIEYLHCPIHKLYLIDLTTQLRTDKFYNAILKFIEEPSPTVHVVIIANSELGILPTILNRCIKFNFEPYTAEQLKEFEWAVAVPNELLYKVCRTPGQFMNSDSSNITTIYNYCSMLIKDIQKLCFANVLATEVSINYKEDYNKFDFNLFINMLEYVAIEDYRKTYNETSLKIYLKTNAFKQQLFNKAVAKEQFIINLLTELWKETR